MLIDSSRNNELNNSDFGRIFDGIAFVQKWQMKFNVNKCSILRLSKHHYKSTFPYSMAGELLNTVDQHPYLVCN